MNNESTGKESSNKPQAVGSGWQCFVRVLSLRFFVRRVPALAETVTGCIMAGASVVGYILGEGLTDAAALKNKKDGDNNGTDV